MILNEEISILTISGLLGIINYWLFYQLDLFHFFNNKNTDEKGTLILLLGFMNVITYQFVEKRTDWNTMSVMILSFVTSIIFELIILFSIKKLSELIISSYYENKKSYRSFENSLVSFFEEKKDKKLFVYIYDFNDKLIDYGYVSSYSYEENENNIIVVLPDDYNPQNEFKDFKDLDYDKVFIDLDRRIKIYSFYVNDRGEEEIVEMQNDKTIEGTSIEEFQYINGQIEGIGKEDLLKIQENIMFWIENCDNKTSVILGVVGIILTIFITSDSVSKLVINIEESINNMNWINLIYLFTVALTILLLAISITFLAKVLISNIDTKTINKKDIATNSLLHFSSIDEIDSNDEYIKKIKATDKDDYLKDLTSQIMIKSHITTMKFRNYNRGVKFLAKAIILLFISVILSFIIFNN